MRKSVVQIKDYLRAGLSYVEAAFATIAIVGSIWYLGSNVGALLTWDWSDINTYFEFLHVVLIVIIGLEVARILITHNLLAVIEVLGFVIARKILVPEADPLEILIVSIAFAVLVGTRWILMRDFNQKFDNVKAHENMTSELVD